MLFDLSYLMLLLIQLLLLTLLTLQPLQYLHYSLLNCIESVFFLRLTAYKDFIVKIVRFMRYLNQLSNNGRFLNSNAFVREYIVYQNK